MAGKRKKKRRSPAQIAGEYRAVKDLREERDDLMAQLHQLNETLGRLERQNVEWMSTIRVMKKSKALLLDEIGRVAARIRETGHAEA